MPEGAPPAEAVRLWADVFRWDEAASRAFAARDSIARTVCLFDPDGGLAAAGRMYYEDNSFWMEALAVREDARGQGYGDLLARMMLDRAARCGTRWVKVREAAGCEGFFARYGFEREGADSSGMSVDAGEIRLCGH